MPPRSVRPALVNGVRAITSNATPRFSGMTPRVTQLSSRRFKSGPYGYTQAKALVYSQHGEPSEVLSCVFHFVTLDSRQANSAKSPHALYIPITPSERPPPSQPRGAYQSRGYKPDSRRVPLAPAIHTPPRHRRPLCHWRQRGLFRGYESWLSRARVCAW